MNSVELGRITSSDRFFLIVLVLSIIGFWFLLTNVIGINNLIAAFSIFLLVAGLITFFYRISGRK